MTEVLLAFLLGAFLTLLIVRRTNSGALKVYAPDDPEESPYLYVELKKPVESICRKKQVLFRVDVRAIRSQK